MTFIPYFVNVAWSHCGINLHMWLHPCIPAINPLVMVWDPFNVLLSTVCSYFVEDLCIYVHQSFSIFCSSTLYQWGLSWPPYLTFDKSLPSIAALFYPLASITKHTKYSHVCLWSLSPTSISDPCKGRDFYLLSVLVTSKRYDQPR